MNEIHTSSKACLQINSSNKTKFRIICITHSGAYATQYAQFEKLLPQNVDCVIYERPGSGIRATENLCSNWPQLMEDVWIQIKPYLNMPYILYGHSLGGSIAFELAKIIETNKARIPLCIGIGDRESPNWPVSKNHKHLSNEEFTDVLVKEYGMNPEVAKTKEIMDFFLPILRNDFKLSDTYFEYCKDHPKINCKIAVFRPDQTNDTLQSHSDWQNCTNNESKIIHVSGDHFFIFNYTKEFLTKLLAFIDIPVL